MLSTPSLGITEIWFEDFLRMQSLAFNSLSRDHGSWSARFAATMADANVIVTFNSLSRDHYKNRCHKGCGSRCFQLPLSGSPASSVSRCDRSRDISTAFNSLSRDHTHHRLGREAVDARAFNSLSRDHYDEAVLLPLIEKTPAFNSLSRDHRARFRDFPALRGVLPRRPSAQIISEATIWIYRFDPL